MSFFSRLKGERSDRIRCAHILLRTEKAAQAALKRLNAGEAFAKVAKDVSTCPSGKRGGDLGRFGRGKMVKEFEDAAFALKRGELSPIIQTQFGFHIIKRLG